jgi:DNA repair exonuclease SbcCD ATPase subunit
VNKRKIVLFLFVSFSIAVLAVRTQSGASTSNQTAKSADNDSSRNANEQEKSKEIQEFLKSIRNMTPEQRIKALKRYREKEREETRKQLELDLEQMYAEAAKQGFVPLIDRKQRQERLQSKVNQWSKDFVREKEALKVNEEQWKLIKPKLEQIHKLRDEARSTIGMSLTSSSSSGTNSRDRTRRTIPTWQWHQPWKGMPSSELTDAQKLTKHLITLVENSNTTPEQFRKTMDALRKARKEEEQIKRQLDEARKELREGLTPRQETALVLMRWL